MGSGPKNIARFAKLPYLKFELQKMSFVVEGRLRLRLLRLVMLAR